MYVSKFESLRFWAKCISVAAQKSIDFANNWQWLCGAPAVASIVARLPNFKGTITLMPKHPAVDVLLIALFAFLITWAAGFFVFLLKAPAEFAQEYLDKIRALKEERQSNADKQRGSAAIEEQTKIMKLGQLNERLGADPHVRAVRERVYEAFRAGEAVPESPLGLTVYLIATNTAWARWQAAQHGAQVGDAQILRLTQSYVLILLEEGRIASRGDINGDQSNRDVIPRDWWGNFMFTLVPDSRQIFRARIVPRSGVDGTAFPGYTSISCFDDDVERIFPRQDEELDSRTNALLVKNGVK